jgi:hypothetical protein
MEELLLPLVPKKKKKTKSLEETSERKVEAISQAKIEKKNAKETKIKKIKLEKNQAQSSTTTNLGSETKPKKKSSLAERRVIEKKKKAKDKKVKNTKETETETVAIAVKSSQDSEPQIEVVSQVAIDETADLSEKIEETVAQPIPPMDAAPQVEPTETSVASEDGANVPISENLPIFELPQEQIDRIHRGRKTTILAKARKEFDWEVGDHIGLHDGTILKILRKEKITMGLNMPEDLVESEGFSPENRAEFARHLQHLGLRANDLAFLYRIELA